MVKIELTYSEVELFKRFREYQTKFERMMRDGVFTIKNGKAILYFDRHGSLNETRIVIINRG